MNAHDRFGKLLRLGFLLLALPPGPMILSAQDATSDAASPLSAPAAGDLKALTDVVRQLQSEIRALRTRVATLEAKEGDAVAESAKLRSQLEAVKAPVPALAQPNEPMAVAKTPAGRASEVSDSGNSAASPQQSTDERISRAEEDLALADARITEQSQTKVESSSKYRVRLSGLALFNLFTNRGIVD